MSSKSFPLEFTIDNHPNPYHGPQVRFSEKVKENGQFVDSFNKTFTYYSDAVKGNGYYLGQSNAHTIQIAGINYTGIVTIQGTLDTAPTEADWFTIPNGAFAFVNPMTQKVQSEIFNFAGNYTWIRAKITISSGIITQILCNF